MRELPQIRHEALLASCALQLGPEHSSMAIRFRARTPWPSSACWLVVAAFSLAGCVQAPPAKTPEVRSDPAAPLELFGTKTPYAPQQDARTLEPVPAGFMPSSLQLVARHGSRGISSPGNDLALIGLWRQAEAADGLTPIGLAIGPALLGIVRANALLGARRAGVSRPGYGNLSEQGVREHRELAARLVQRQPAWGRAVSVQARGSGVDRAMESGRAFLDGLAGAAPQLAARLPATIASDRYQLYFHRLGEADRAGHESALERRVWEASRRFQAYERSGVPAAATERIRQQPEVQAAARSVVLRLFKPGFVNRLRKGEVQAEPVTDLRFVSRDGSFVAAPRAQKQIGLRSELDTAVALFEMLAICASMPDELQAEGVRVADLRAVFSSDDARAFAWLLDAEEFYAKGPVSLTDGSPGDAMTEALLQDFLAAIDAAGQRGDGPLLTLRFTHAEIVMPWVTRLRIPPYFDPLPPESPYRYDTNAWRSARVSPMAANIQWESYRDATGQVIVRMLHNERQAAFGSQCDTARWALGSHFYRLTGLRTCLAAVPAAGSISHSGPLPHAWI
jgi:hypothetical protein